jgi:hypothetical protein
MFPLEDCWYARHQLFFTCVMRPKNGILPKEKRCKTGPDDIGYTLGSNTYEVNPWLWQFGLGKPRLGGLSIEQTGERKQVASDALHKRAAETNGLALSCELPVMLPRTKLLISDKSLSFSASTASFHSKNTV